MIQVVHRVFVIVGMITLLAVLTLILLFPRLGSLITIDEPPVKSDTIIILMGNVVPRAEKAFELYKAGFAPTLTFVRPEDSPAVKAGFTSNDGDATLRLLSEWGVPREDIEFLDQNAVTSTMEEAEVLIEHLKIKNYKSYIGVTSWYHTSRARWVLTTRPDHQISSTWSAAYSKQESPEQWFRMEASFLNVFNEYLKWVYYLVKYC